MSKQEKPGFMLYHPFVKLFEQLSLEERGILITALFEYSEFETVSIPLSPLVEMAFTCMRETLDRDRISYELRCRRASENGKKGGRPPKEENPTLFS